jgi:hypothetical protein
VKNLILLTFLLLASCDPTYLDEGLLIRDGVDLYAVPPLGISASPEMVPHVLRATSWWNRQIGDTVFFSPTPTPDVTVSSGYVPSEDYDPVTASGDLDGIAYLEYSRWDGLIVSCEVVISSDILYAREAHEATKHELGHCLGLADDPQSLDLNSIMSSPMPWSGEVTEHDREIIRRMQ